MCINLLRVRAHDKTVSYQLQHTADVVAENSTAFAHKVKLLSVAESFCLFVLLACLFGAFFQFDTNCPNITTMVDWE